MDLKNICALGRSFSYVKHNLLQIQKVIDFIDNNAMIKLHKTKYWYFTYKKDDNHIFLFTLF